MVRAVIIGTGDHAYGLSHLFSINNNEDSGHYLEVTKKDGLGRVGETFHDTDVTISDFDEALQRAEIVILAIPAKALKFFVNDHYSLLKEKVLVDATNSTVADEDLHSLLSVTDVRWVKAFNDIGAVDALTKKPYGKKKISVSMCSPSADALETVKTFGEESLGLDVKVVPYHKYSEIAQHQNSLGEEWIISTIIMLAIFIVCMVYNIVRHPVIKGYPWRQFPLFCMNKGISWACLTGFALAQVPGILARMSHAYHRDSLRDMPKWLTRFLAIRKHIGLISLWFLTVHIFMSCLMFSIAYYSRFFYDKNDPFSRMSANGESSFLFGTIAAALYIVLGICSLPSVAEQMTNKQWQLVYGPVAWTSLAFGTAHVMCQGIGVTWNKKENWAGGMPPITLMSVLFPLVVMTMKLIQVVFVWGMDRYYKKHEVENKKTDNSIKASSSPETGDLGPSDSDDSNNDK